MSNPACSFSRRFYLRQHQASMIEKGSTRRGQVDTASRSSQKFGAHLGLKVSNLPTQGRLRRVQFPRRRYS